MAIGAVRVMAAGKAGLESLPFFVDEMMAQGITQLAPWAADHSQDQIDELHAMTQSRVNGSWSRLFGVGISPPGTVMDTDTGPNRRLLQLVNPLAAEARGLADSPAQLGAWCRRRIWEYVRETEALWERYKAENGVTGSYHLAVVIPYCPEGPTSGTVGMYLGAALRQYFSENGKANELMVWGIELCPPARIDNNKTDDENDDPVGNAFRGYIARDELLKGVPLSDDNANDATLNNSFDINIVFDGGRAELATASTSTVLQAIDRAAAQTTACLINGAAGGDAAESDNRLLQGARWNAHLAHVVSERYYGPASRYLRYHVALPWERDPEAWDSATIADRKRSFLYRIDNDIKPRIGNEQDSAVKSHAENLVKCADEVRPISLDANILEPFTRKRKNAEKAVAGWLNQAVSDDRLNYKEAQANSQDTEGRIIPKEDLFCINVVLPEMQRREAAVIERDNSVPGAISDILGDSGISQVRSRLSGLCNKVLDRSDCDAITNNSDAFFDEIISISAENREIGRNEGFRPTRENLGYYLAADKRNTNGTFYEFSFDLNKVISAPAADDDQSTQPGSLKWKVNGVPYDVPVEYSILTLALVRKGDGFKDISTYDALKDNYEKIVGDREEWRKRARYYGVKPPPQLIATGNEAENPPPA